MSAPHPLNPPLPQGARRTSYVLILILFAFLVLNHAVALPIFEASDEAAHFIYAHQLAATGALPVIPSRDELDSAAQRGDTVAQWSIESHQPPLYYTLAAALIAPTTTRADIADYLVSNDVIFTWGIAQANPNVWLHPPSEPGGDTLRAVWIVRFFSLLFGCGTLVLMQRAAYLATGSRAAALTVMFATASLPMFVVVSGSVTNDAPIIFLSTAGAWWSLRVAMHGLRRFDPLLIGAILAAAALTKITGLALFGLVFVALALGVRGGKITVRWAIISVLTAGGMTAVLAGWWYVRNVTLYGDVLATAATADLWGRQFGTAGESGGWPELARIYNSFWLMVGHLHAPVWAQTGFYGATLALVAASMAGWVIVIRRARTGYMLSLQTTLIVVLCVILPILMLLVGTKNVDISYGRLLFPGLVGFMTLLVIGWRGLIGRFAPLLILPLTLTAALMPYTLTAPAYPPIIDSAALPESAVPLNVTADGFRLDGYEMLDKSASVGDNIRAALYFTSDTPKSIVFAVSITDGAARLGGVTLYPGMAAGQMLRPGQMYRAVVTMPLDSASTLAAPHLTQLQIALFDAPESPSLPLSLPDGQAAQVLTLDGVVYLESAYQAPPPKTSVTASFGGALSLNGYTLNGDAQAGDILAVALDWSIIGGAPPDISATLQVLDDAGTLITQYDDSAQNYPSRAWIPGTSLITHHTLLLPVDLPPGDYRLVVGWYRLDENFTRLPATAAETTNDLAIIGRVMISGYNQ